LTERSSVSSAGPWGPIVNPFQAGGFDSARASTRASVSVRVDSEAHMLSSASAVLEVVSQADASELGTRPQDSCVAEEDGGPVLETPLSASSSLVYTPLASIRTQEVETLSRAVRKTLYKFALTYKPSGQGGLDGLLQGRGVSARQREQHGRRAQPQHLASIADDDDGAANGGDALPGAVDDAAAARLDCATDTRWAAEGGAVPLEVSLERCLLRPMELRARAVDAVVVAHFVGELRLVQRLRLLTKYLLMGESRLVETFVVEALERYAAPGRLDEAVVPLGGVEGAVNMLFEATVPHPHDAEDELFFSSIHFAMAVTPSPLGAGPLKFLEAMRLELRLQFPLSLVFTEHMLLQYSRLFQLLALVQYALHGVKAAWFQMAKLFGGRGHTGHRIPTSVRALRHHVQFFLTTLQRYLIVDVVAAEFFRMEAALARAESLEQLVAAHAGFLEMCESKAFLGLGARDVLSTILGLLQQALRLQRAFGAAAAEAEVRVAAQSAPRMPPGVLRELQGLEVTFHDLRWKLKLSLPDDADAEPRSGVSGSSGGTGGRAAGGAGSNFGAGRFAVGCEDFLEEWLVAWARRCSQ